jgi:hypothetical protein
MRQRCKCLSRAESDGAPAEWADGAGYGDGKGNANDGCTEVQGSARFQNQRFGGDRAGESKGGTASEFSVQQQNGCRRWGARRTIVLRKSFAGVSLLHAR